MKFREMGDNEGRSKVVCEGDVMVGGNSEEFSEGRAKKVKGRRERE